MSSIQANVPSLHDPVRGHNEAQSEYKTRRTASKSAAQLPTDIAWAGKRTSRQILRDTMRGDGEQRKDGSMKRHHTMSLRTRSADALMAHFAKQRKLGNIKHSPV